MSSFDKGDLRIDEIIDKMLTVANKKEAKQLGAIKDEYLETLSDLEDSMFGYIIEATGTAPTYKE